MISFLLNIRPSIRYFLLVVYMGCIMALSLLPPDDFPKVPLFEGIDKVVHFMMYFLFSALLSWAVKADEKNSRFFLVIPATIGWGIFMEIMQLNMHLGRSFSWYDILANSIGVMTGVLFYFYVVRLSKSR